MRSSIAPSELTCSGDRCTAQLQVELTSDTGVGPREVEVRLIDGGGCDPDGLRRDGRIDAWGN